MPQFWLRVLFFLAAVPLTDLATTVVPWDDTKIKHTWNGVPVNWESLGHPSADSTIDLNIILKPDQDTALTDALSEVSDPNHPRYRAFLSKEQVDELVKPSPDTVELINAWLVHHGIQSSSISMTHRGNWLTITDVRVSQASQLLGASYQLYRNVITNETVIRTVGYSLPAVLYTHVQTVMPTTYFSSMGVTLQTPQRRPFGPAPAQAQGSEKLGMVQARQPPPEPAIVNPPDLRWLYGTVDYVPIAYNPGQNSLAVVGSELPSLHDLTMFMDDYRRTTNGEAATFIMVNVGGGPLPLDGFPGETSNVAVQYASAMAYPTPLTFYRTLQTEEAFMDLIEFFLILPIVPRTIIISFNYFLEHNLPPPSARYICNLFEQFGARGSSVLVASGNNGVGAAGSCRTFDVEFPSSCPWVTSVGGTQSMRPEVATPHSGGGFSRLFQRPGYQNRDVLTYIQQLEGEFDGRYNPRGRGYPDISAQGLGCDIVLDGDDAIAVGTACAVSTAAGIISLLNDYMISTRTADEEPDEAPLGFLNPWLYSNEVRQVLNDIEGGSNPGCGTTGFRATQGWDPVTGLGTLNFERLRNILRLKRFGPSPSPLPAPP